MRSPARKELKKPKTAPDKGKRYRCCICRKRAPQKTTDVPYFCSEHAHLADLDPEERALAQEAEATSAATAELREESDD